MRVLRTFVFHGSLAIAAILGPASAASAQIYHASLSGAQEVPAAATTATGAAKIEVNEATGALTFTVVFNGLSSNQTASHIHAPAAIGATAGVAINFGAVGGTSGTISGTTTITPTQLTQLRSGLAYVNVHSSNFPAGEIRGQLAVARPFDYDSDGRTDLTIARFPNVAPPGVAQITNWTRNSTDGVVAFDFGDANRDIPIPGDFDGDGRTDYAVYRGGATPADQSKFLIQFSGLGVANSYDWGVGDDVPVPADYDGDGKTDFAIFRRTGGQTLWYIYQSKTQTVRFVPFGTTGDGGQTSGDVPVPADYDGDGKVDIAVLRVNTNQYWILRSSDSAIALTAWGNFQTDYTVPGDYDGDGRADLTAARTGATSTSPLVWWQLMSSTGASRTLTFGRSSDRPVQGDYDGDGRIDIAIYRPGATPTTQSTFWYFSSFNGTAVVIGWGIGADYAPATFGIK